MLLYLLLILLSSSNGSNKILLLILLFSYINNCKIAKKLNCNSKILNKGYAANMKSYRTYPSYYNMVPKKNANNSVLPVANPDNKCKPVSVPEINGIEKYIKDKYRGVNITMLLSSGTGAQGEVVFNFDRLISIKSMNNTYFIDPDSIDIFF